MRIGIIDLVFTDGKDWHLKKSCDLPKVTQLPKSEFESSSVNFEVKFPSPAVAREMLTTALRLMLPSLNSPRTSVLHWTWILLKWLGTCNSSSHLMPPFLLLCVCSTSPRLEPTLLFWKREKHSSVWMTLFPCFLHDIFSKQQKAWKAVLYREKNFSQASAHLFNHKCFLSVYYLEF